MRFPLLGRNGTGGSRAKRLVAVGVAAIASLLGPLASGASANQNFLSGSLSIWSASCCNDYHVRVVGHAHMPQADAQRFINTPGHEVRFQLWGADGGFNFGDDQLTGDFFPSSYWAGADGLYFSRQILVDGSTLDEDNGQDDVYARIRLLDIRTGHVHYAHTNQVHAYF